MKRTLKKDVENLERIGKAQLGELKKIETDEGKIEAELKRFEKEVEKLKGIIKPSAVEKFTYKDIARGLIGAILGMGLMGWHDGVRNAVIGMSIINIAAIFLLTIISGVSVLYFSQYKKIKETWIIHQLLPKRFVIFYLLSIAVVFCVYLLFNIIRIGITPPDHIVKLVIAMGLPAMIGAGTADTIR